jgi:hypothetical protein
MDICISRIGVFFGNLPTVREPCFAGAEVPLDVYLPKIPRRNRRKSL